MRYLLPLLLWSLLGSTHALARSLVVYCSHDPDACEFAAQTFQRKTGIEMAGDPELRKRLLARWQKEIGDSLR